MPDVEPRARYQLVSPNLRFAPYRAEEGVKRFELTAEEVQQTVVGGVWMKAWGYNGTTPGPLLVMHEHERVEVLLRNRLSEPTAIHWNGLVLPGRFAGMPLVGAGPWVQPGDEYLYEFTPRQRGTYLYHAEVLNARQQLMGLCGMMVVLPLEREPVDKDFAILLQEWNLKPLGATAGLTQEQVNWADKKAVKRLHRIDPMADQFNYFTMNGKAFPDTAPLTVRPGERIKLRIGNVGMHAHPMHLHGHVFQVTAMDGQPMQSPLYKTTVNVPPGETVELQFTADNPGVWALHCSKPRHIMNTGQNMGGMMTTLRYVDAIEKDGTRHSQ